MVNIKDVKDSADIVIFLPYPISVNNYYYKGRILTKKGREYTENVSHAAYEQGVKGLRLSMHIHLSVIIYPPDKRIRDLDNIMKSLQDSLTKAEVWEDDKLIDQLSLYRGVTVKQGSIVCIIREAGPKIPLNVDHNIYGI